MDLISHVKTAFEKAERGESRLPADVYTSGLHRDGFLQGMSTSKVRHFMNNVCNFPEVRYLEIGTYAGSTLISAAYENPGTYLAIDNCSWNNGNLENSGIKISEAVYQNLERFGVKDRVSYHIDNCWQFDKNKIPFKANVYFYDGDHAHGAQEQALTYFAEALANEFVFIVDDWREQGGKVTAVEKGTRSGIKKCDMEVLFEMEAPPGDYHQGLGIFILKKPGR